MKYRNFIAYFVCTYFITLDNKCNNLMNKLRKGSEIMIGNFNAINLKQMYERLSQDEDVLSLKQKYDSEKRCRAIATFALSRAQTFEEARMISGIIATTENDTDSSTEIIINEALKQKVPSELYGKH